MALGMRACLVLSKDPCCEALVEVIVRQFGFRPRLAHSLDDLENLSTTMPTVAWFVDLDGITHDLDLVTARARLKAPDAKLVFLSTNFTRDLAVKCVQHQAIALLLKPVVLERLVTTFHQLAQEPELLDKEDTETPEVDPPAVERGPVSSESGSASPLLRTVELTCPICATSFRSLRFKTWRFPVTDLDTDFCPLGEGTIHPELYSIMVCPTCLFAYLAGQFVSVRVLEPHRQGFLQPELHHDREQGTFGLSFSGERTMLHGVRSFGLAALATQQLKVRSFLKLAGEYYLKAAWLCRRIGHRKEELNALEQSLACMLRVYKPYLMTKDRFPSEASIYAKMEPGMDHIGERGVVVTCFLIGDLSRRLGLNDQAEQYYAEAIKLPFLTRFTSLMRHIHVVVRQFRESFEPA